MYIKNIELINFRSYENLKLNLVPGINVLYGDNGSGKTNILEAAHWISLSRSFRSYDDSVLIRNSAAGARVRAEISDNDMDKLFSIEYSNSPKRKIIRENNTRLVKISDMIGKIPVVLFSPENIMMVKGEPALRRRFIDDFISQIDKEYFIVSMKYSKEISHRNYVLKKIRDNNFSKSSLDIWNEQIIKNGTYLILARTAAVEMLNNILKEKLLEAGLDIRIDYIPKVKMELSEDGIRKAYKEFFMANMEEEISRAVTLIGPHRDDLEISYGKRSAKMYASEGQQRITAIILKLSEGLAIREKRGSFPVVLLDDFSSELDDANRGFVGKTFKLFKQILITTTHKANLKGFEAAREFIIKDNTAKELS